MNVPRSPVMTVTRSFERRQPVHQVVGHRALGQRRHHRDQVLVLAPGLVRGARRHAGVGLLGHPRGQVDVVGAQVLDHPDVGDPGRERALPAGGHLVHVTELAGLQPGPRLLQRRVVPLDVPDRADQPGVGERPRQLLRPRGVLRQRLLDQGVHPRRGQRQPDLLVVDRRHRDHAVVDPGLDQRLHRLQHRPAAGHPVRVTARVGHRDQVHPVQATPAPWRGGGPSSPARSGPRAGCAITHPPSRGR